MSVEPQSDRELSRLPAVARRSVLYMPGSNARALEKARELPADAVILDLEDAVAPELKDMARAQVCAAVRAGFGSREVVVRINSLDSDWGDRDLLMAAAARPNAILIPKVGSARDIHRAEQRLAHAVDSGGLALWAMIETPRGVLDVGGIAGAGGRLACLVAGTNDLLKEMGARPMPDRLNIAAALSAIVVAARCHGLAVIDGVFNDIADADGFAAQCAQGRSFGFDGKTVIHPSQITPANVAFAPSPDDVETARKIIAAFELPENRGKGAILVDGRMVERLHADSARRMVALHEAITA
jgi:citrate lyase subunit beta / citryl-CoA lyase